MYYSITMREGGFMTYQLVAVKVGQREDSAAQVQSILTEFGCGIKIRLGLHDLPEGICSPSGLIILQVSAAENEVNGFVEKLNRLKDVTAKSLVI